ncbi:protein kinase [Glaciihabitans sp. UYNi722]|uniref:protein kinase domain-containing protein n=1 Tax=Glaciihabitans sp. UYNi722 TaxID=3156344 RepID=UPI003393792B
MDVVGGYRLVRKLGEGERAEVYLGHAGSGGLDDAERIAAVKVYRSTTSAESIDTEIEALARASSRHLLDLQDLAIAPDGLPSLVLPRLGSGSLARLVDTRSWLDAGEVVTAITPIATALDELHRVGVAHGGVQLSAVLLDATGTPVLAGFGLARLIGPFPPGETGSSLTPAQLEENDEVLGDLADLAGMTRALLERIDGQTPAVSDLRRWIDETLPGVIPGSFGTQLSERLFDLAPARPLVLRNASPEGTGRVIPLRTASLSSSAQENRDDAARVHLAGIHVPEWIEDVMNASLESHPLAALRARLVRALAPVRRSVWIMGGIGVAAVIAALVILPAGQGTKAASNGAEPSRSASAQPTKSKPQPVATEKITGEDPLGAAEQLLEVRRSCLSRRSVTCLDGVNQKESAAMDADVGLIRRLQQGKDASPDESLDDVQLQPVQRLGDSAIVGFTLPGDDAQPASLLMMKSDAGWRIRDLILD